MTPVHVALVINSGLGFFRDALRGIRQYALTKPQWVFLSTRAEAGAVKAFQRSPPDGVIGQVLDKTLHSALEALGRPVVNISRVAIDLPWPRVGVDEALVGRLVADHLLERGLRRFAFIGHPAHGQGASREAAFRRALEAAGGYDVACYRTPAKPPLVSTGRPWPLDRRIVEWLRALPKPVGVLAASDLLGAQLSEVCHEAALRVPDEVAIVGVDNDDLLCSLSHPPLSSVALPAKRIGYEAAAMLDRWLARGKPPRKPVLLRPLGVVARKSSDVVSSDDPDLVEALRFIRDHGHRPLSVKEVLRAVPVSRRSLERRARQALGRTLGAEIRRVHVERAKELLAGTELPMPLVAEHAGFCDASHLCVAFRRETGVTPSAYRRQFRDGRDAESESAGKQRKLHTPAE